MGKAFKGKVIVINGGTKGVGYGVAEAVAREGGTVVFSGFEPDGERKFAEMQKKYGMEGMFLKIDLADCQSCEDLIYQTADKYGKVDGYFHYAGVTNPLSVITEITKEEFDFIFDRNIRGAMFGCKAAVKVMEKQGYGSIVLTGSAHGLGGGEIDHPVYGASKGALLTLMKHISNRYADKGIRANYITMGWVPTESEIKLRKSLNKSDEWLEETAAGCIPLGRLVQVSDMVPGITYLLGDDSQMVTGTKLHITGGMTYI